jgi:serine/threonine protein kinase
MPPAVSLIAHRGSKKLYRAEATTMDVDERYDVVSVIGRGSYGVVVKCEDSVTQKRVAIKKIEHVFADLIDGRRIWRELCVLRLLRDAQARNVMLVSRLQQPTEDLSRFQDIYVVTDLYTGDLTSVPVSHLPSIGGRTGSAKPNIGDGLRCVLADILTGVADMHALGIIHRDLKPQNVLADNQNRFYLCDFGLARGGLERVAALPTSFTDHVVTRWYRAPELLVMGAYHYPIDVFSVACVAAEVALKKPLFPGRDYLDQLRLVAGGVHPEGDVDLSFIENETARRFIMGVYAKKPPPMSCEERLTAAHVPATVLRLIMDLCAFNPDDRPSASQALEDPLLCDLVVPHPQRELLAPRSDHDWSIDALPEVPEARLRRMLWSELQHYRNDPGTCPKSP